MEDSVCGGAREGELVVKRGESRGEREWGARSKLRVKLSVEVSGPVIRDCF